MPLEGTTILLAEDDLILAELYTDRLKQEGFNVVHASNGEDALHYVEEYHPSLIILDIMMPRMNGLDVLKELKSHEDTSSIPVIIVTALVQEIEKVNKMMNPADAYIVKSEVLPAEIIQEVKRRLERDETDLGYAPDASSNPMAAGTDSPDQDQQAAPVPPAPDAGA